MKKKNDRPDSMTITDQVRFITQGKGVRPQTYSFEDAVRIMVETGRRICRLYGSTVYSRPKDPTITAEQVITQMQESVGNAQLQGGMCRFYEEDVEADDWFILKE
jgi:hypothetical protein